MNSHEALDYFHAAQEALAQGDLVNALARLTKALALDETLAEARLLHGQLLLKMGYKEEAEAEKLLSDAKLLSELGCFAIVLEKIPAALTRKVCESVNVPVIGIGAGQADGQVLVVHDMLGMTKGFSPKFLRRYADLSTVITDAVGQYITDVKNCDFPSEAESY